LWWVLVVFVMICDNISLRAQDVERCIPAFQRGDTDANGELEITDPIVLLRFLFTGDAELPCEDAADSNDDGNLDIADSIFALSFLFDGSTRLPMPNVACGVDPTFDELGCGNFSTCGTVNCGVCETEGDCASLDLDYVQAYDCIDGKCVIAECEEGTWDVDQEIDNGCESFRAPNGEPCDDGNPCTTGDMYIGGLCGGRPLDCSRFANTCNNAVCDPDTGECVLVPRPRRVCDDDNPDTAGDHCDQTGECVGTPVR
jgi:hypothetical protein